MSVAPGWYKDPAEPTTQRYWDGEGWVGTPLPADATPPPGPPPPPVPEIPVTPTNGTQPPPVAPPPRLPPPGPAPLPWQPPPGTAPPPGAAPPPGPIPPGPIPPGPVPPGHPQAYPYPPPYAYKPPPTPHGLRLASVGARFVARLIDIGAVFLLNVVVNGWFVWRYVQEIAPLYRELNRRAQEGEPLLSNLPQAGDQAGSLQIVIVLIAAALWFAYEVPATANTGQTLGKRVMRIQVVRVESADRLGFGRSFRRWNTLGLPTLLWTCCIGFILQLVDCIFLLFDRPLHQALHDKSAHTVVVEVPRSADPEPGGKP